MAPRLLAKKYLRSLGWNVLPSSTERTCMEAVIASHRQLNEAKQRAVERAAARGWFGRLLWRLFGRWL